MSERRPDSDGNLFSPFKKIKQASMNNVTRTKTTFNDPIYETIEMEGLCKRIIDTPEFQRLGECVSVRACVCM
jgi:hypothetical protein